MFLQSVVIPFRSTYLYVTLENFLVGRMTRMCKTAPHPPTDTWPIPIRRCECAVVIWPRTEGHRKFHHAEPAACTGQLSQERRYDKIKEKTRQDKTRRDETRLRQDQTRWDETRWDKTSQIRQDKIKASQEKIRKDKRKEEKRIE